MSVYAGPYGADRTILTGRIDDQGQLVTNHGRVYNISNIGNLGKNVMGKEVRVTGFIVGEERTGHENILVVSYHVLNSSKYWDNCTASCEIYYPSLGYDA